MEQQTGIAAVCMGCGNNSSGNFCNQCGEDLHPRRFTFKNIITSIPDIFFDVENGLFYTIKELIKDPAAAVSSFLAGNRARHYKPLKFLLFMSGLYALFFIYFDINGVESMYGDLTDAKTAKLLDDQYVKCQSIINVFALPFLSFLTWLFFLKKNLYYGEHLLINCFIIGIVLFMQNACFPIMLIKNRTEWVDRINDILFLVTIYIATRTYYGLFYEKNRRNLLKAIFKTLAIIFILAFWYLITSPLIIYLKVGLLGE
jgi:hypothetical protein